MSEYIEREAVYRFCKDQCVKETGAYSKGLNSGLQIAMSAARNSDAIPSATVVPTGEISDAVYEALRVLDAIRSKGTMEYNDYSDLHYAISMICVEPEQEAHNGRAKDTLEKGSL